MSGNVWMISDQIDDEDVEFMTHDFVTYNMNNLCARAEEIIREELIFV